MRILRRNESEGAVSYAITSFDEAIEIIDFAFFDAAEMLFLLKVTEGTSEEIFALERCSRISYSRIDRCELQCIYSRLSRYRL